MVVFLCSEEIDSIWSGIYDAGVSKIPKNNLRIEVGGFDQELFAEYRNVESSKWKVDTVMKNIYHTLSYRIYDFVTLASLSQDPLRADKIYRFLYLAYRSKGDILNQLHVKEVGELYYLNRNYNRELHHLQGFTRFDTLNNGILYGKISPKNDILPILYYHFIDRMPCENWILHDEKRKKAVVYHKNNGLAMVSSQEETWLKELSEKVDNQQYDKLWKVFHHSISIKERENRVLQRNLVPIHYRKNMTEWN